MNDDPHNDQERNRHEQRRQRFRNIPAPAQLNRRRNIENDGDFEEAAIESTLAAMGKSRHDGADFLVKVQRKLAGRPAPVHEVEEAFFGMGSLLPSQNGSTESGLETQKELPVETASPGKPMFKILTMAATAAVVCVIAGWFYFSESEDSTAKNSGNAPASTQPAEDKLSNLANDISKEEITDINSEPAIFGSKPSLPEPLLVEDSTTKPDEGLIVEPNDLAATDIVKSSAENELTTNYSSAPTGPPENSLWNLRLKFKDDWSGTISVNDEDLKNKISRKDAVSVLKKIGHEVARRVHFVGPYLNSDWIGEVHIQGPEFKYRKHFDGIDEMYAVVLDARETLEARLEQAQPPAAVPLSPFTIGFISREAAKKQSQLELKSRAQHPAVTEATENSLDVLLGNLNSYPRNSLPSKRYKQYRQLTEAQLTEFQLAGKFVFPTKIDELFISNARFQETEPKALVSQLKQTTQFDIFQNDQDFEEWIMRVGAQNPRGLYWVKNRKLSSDIMSLQSKMKSAKNAVSKRAIQLKIRRLLNDQRELSNLVNVMAISKEDSSKPAEPMLSILPVRPELNGFPLVMGDACHLEEEGAKTLSNISTNLGGMLERLGSFGSRNTIEPNLQSQAFMRKLIRRIAKHPDAAQALRTMDQMLQIESPKIRLELVDALAQMGNDVSCDLLACYAKFDVDPGIRTAATDALRSYPPEMARAQLISGFRYPWPEVAKHTAEAMTRLNDTEAVPQLVHLLANPDPRMPAKIDDETFVQREMVAVNHMRNCLLCHSDSQNPTDPGRAVIPIWGEMLPPMYYAGDRGAPMVRADITYLRQDFSVIHKVADAKPWPEHQRFDYIVRKKLLEPDEAHSIAKRLGSGPNEYKAAIVKTLRILTGKEPIEDTYEAWSSVVGRQKLESLPQVP